MKSIDYVTQSELLKVIAHPVRLMILEELSKEMKCVNEVEHLLGKVKQPNISQHLALLRHRGIVSFRREGRKRCYFLTNPQMVCDLLSLLRSEYWAEWRPGEPLAAGLGG